MGSDTDVSTVVVNVDELHAGNEFFFATRIFHLSFISHSSDRSAKGDDQSLERTRLI